MKELVKKTIKEYNLIDEKDKIVVGVSGGHDSMALLYVLESLKQEMNFEITVAHINHGVRGLESDGDEEYVKTICCDLGIAFYSHKVNMDEYAKIHKMTSEEAGREIRYTFFRKIVAEVGATKIAVAHNKNDQAETLLLRFMRGTGVDGLRGMEYKNDNVIRPLLAVERDDIEEFCEEQCIDPRIDKTNFMPIYGRNKVRLELIPFIEKTFNSGIINTLFRTSEIMKTDSDFLEQQTQAEFKNSLKSREGNRITLDSEKLKNMHEAIASRVIRSSIEKLNYNLKGIERKHIEDIIGLVTSNKTGKSIDIGNSMTVKTSYTDLILEKNQDMEQVDYIHKIKIDNIIYIPELDIKIKANVYSKSDVNIDFNNPFLKCFDYDNIKSEIYIRNRKDGDRFVPIGMKGHKKLKDFFIDEKIPKEKRNMLPLILDGETIIWVVGYRTSENYKVSSNTKKVLVLEYTK